VGLGPAKGKDFATSLGPVLVTVDEFDGGAAAMVARVNGEERSRGNLRDLYHGWDAILERASLNTRLRPGEVLGSGTVGTGCILEANDGRWLSGGGTWWSSRSRGSACCATPSAPLAEGFSARLAPASPGRLDTSLSRD